MSLKAPLIRGFLFGAIAMAYAIIGFFVALSVTYIVMYVLHSSHFEKPDDEEL